MLKLKSKKLFNMDSKELTQTNKIYQVVFGYMPLENTTEEIENLMHKYTVYLEKKKPGLIMNLIKLIEQYPQIPMFKNYLAVAYEQNKQEDKTEEVIKDTVAKHPNYSFGLFSLASLYLKQEKIDLIDKRLIDANDIIDVFPEREKFHVSEIFAFNQFYCSYHISKGDFQKVDERLKNLKQLAKNDKGAWLKFEELDDDIRLKKIAYNLKRMQSLREKEKQVIATFKDFFGQTEVSPVFNHVEINDFYDKGLDISGELLKSILVLPRQTLIEDLESVLADTQKRYNFFKDDKSSEYESNFYLNFHAIFLLAELQAKESVDKIFNLFRQDEDFYDFWFGDYFETLTIPIYKLTQDNLPFLASFIKEENNYTWFRLIASQVVQQIGLHQPDRRTEVLEWYKDVFNYFLANAENEKLIDGAALASMVDDVLSLQGKELMSVIEPLFTKELVSELFSGNWEDVQKEIDEPTTSLLSSNKKLIHLNIFETYAKLKTGDSLNAPDTEEDEAIREKLFSIIDTFEEDDFNFNFDEDEDDWEDAPPLKLLRPKFNYSRNDKVSVKYENGKILKDVKFKKVEDDLIAGVCQIID